MVTEVRHGIVIRLVVDKKDKHEVDLILEQLKSKAIPGYFELVYLTTSKS